MDQATTKPLFPAALLDWAGHRGGGVRRLFSSSGGRPSGVVFRTPLLGRLEHWAKLVAENRKAAPRFVLLAGGPGNGKTEAVEFAIAQLDKSLGLSGLLLRKLEDYFVTRTDEPPPRRALVDLVELSAGRISGRLHVVQDASATDHHTPSTPPASLFVDDLEVVAASPEDIYLACVNRGVLDDALINATDSGRSDVESLLAEAIRAVGMAAEPLPCWPLAKFPDVAVWPMDLESLIAGAPSDGDVSPASQLVSIAVDTQKWPEIGSCPAAERCPFCISRHLLDQAKHREALLRVLHWYELASGKRLTFRDLFSLMSYLLSGLPASEEGRYEPCSWAARLLDSVERNTKNPLPYKAPFVLVAAQYQHALFFNWPRINGRRFRSDLVELGLNDHPALIGLAQFLSSRTLSSMPPTMEAQLLAMSALLDPAVANPDSEVPVSAQTTIRYRDIDTRFSQSVGEGLQFINRYHCLSPLEIDLLRRLDAADQKLSSPEVSRLHAAKAARIQAVLRDFSCRLVRRSLGVRAAAVKDAEILVDFEKVVAGDVQLLHESARQVEGLLNSADKFVISLNTTFGQPLPPVQRQAILTTPKQRVKAHEPSVIDRPRTSVRFLSVGSGQQSQSIPLTYDLFKSVKELGRGMMPASLPRTVVALLDTTRARLAGYVVRHKDLLDGSEIQVGGRPEVIVRELDTFLIRRKEAE